MVNGVRQLKVPYKKGNREENIKDAVFRVGWSRYRY